MRTAALLLLALDLHGQNRFTPGDKPFIAAGDPVIALQHVRVIDGTGDAPAENQTIVIANGKIQSVGANVTIPANARVLDLAGHTVIPGLVGMHEHLFYPSGAGIPIYTEQAFSFPRLYLASGVTTARTAGSLEPYTDLNVKRLIDAGQMPGPKMHITGPYLEGKGSFAAQMHELTGPDDAVRTVDYWAAEGVTSFKAYMNIDRAELKAAVDAAHKHGIKVTGHLCAVGFREAAVAGIDNLEHGLLVDTEFDPGKQPDVCPSQGVTVATIDRIDIDSQPVRDTIADLVAHHVAITSTLSVFEAFDSARPPLEQRFLDAVAPESAISYLASRARARTGPEAIYVQGLKKELAFERAFVKAGGLLMFGADPTGNGGALAGFADQRNLELLVEGGFTPVEAIKIATRNGAEFLGELDRIGTIAAGKQADLVVVQGNPATRMADVRNVKLVFKDGAGYDPAKLLDSVKGQAGLH
ncbi:MAG TPA: amidohydrolase family protein [Candidatus Limnocylindrales bacterium]|nr:amidohydrolase family protein [Candidatus Limnocylindrales bacterium]